MYKIDEGLGAKYFGSFSPLVPSKREKNVLVFLSLYVHFLREVFAFQFLNDKIHDYVFLTYYWDIYRDSKRSRANFKIFTLICKYIPQTLVVPTYIAI